MSDTSTPNQSAEAMASRFYGGPVKAEPASTPEAAPAERALANLYGTPAEQFQTAHKAELETLAELGLPEDTRQAWARGAAEAFGEMRISDLEARTLHRTVVRALRSPPTAEQRAAWRRESQELLKASDANKRMALVRDWLETRPGLLQLLADAGVADHPGIVGTLLTRAYVLPRTKAQGR